MVSHIRKAVLALALIPGLQACGTGEAVNPIRAAFAAEVPPRAATPVVFRFPISPGRSWLASTRS